MSRQLSSALARVSVSCCSCTVSSSPASVSVTSRGRMVEFLRLISRSVSCVSSASKASPFLATWAFWASLASLRMFLLVIILRKFSLVMMGSTSRAWACSHLAMGPRHVLREARLRLCEGRGDIMKRLVGWIVLVP